MDRRTIKENHCKKNAFKKRWKEVFLSKNRDQTLKVSYEKLKKKMSAVSTTD